MARPSRVQSGPCVWKSARPRPWEPQCFVSKNGTPLNESNLLRRIAKSLGIPGLSWHVFRHTHSTLGEQIGMALSGRQAQMEQGDVRMAMHSTHSDSERRRAAIETMAGPLLREEIGNAN